MLLEAKAIETTGIVPSGIARHGLDTDCQTPTSMAPRVKMKSACSGRWTIFFSFRLADDNELGLLIFAGFTVLAPKQDARNSGCACRALGGIQNE